MLFGKDCSVSVHVYFSNFISISQITVGPYNQRILFSNVQFIFLIIYCPSIIVSFPTTLNVKFLIIEKQPLPTCASRKEEIYVIVKKNGYSQLNDVIFIAVFFFSYPFSENVKETTVYGDSRYQKMQFTDSLFLFLLFSFLT